MDESKKKPILIGVIVGCLVLAGAITFFTRSGGGGGIPNEFADRYTWMTCRNPDCGNSWEMNLKEYYEMVEQFRIENPGVMENPAAAACPKCSEPSGYAAVKCEKCGLIFEKNSVPRTFEDKCPDCGHSAIEERRKKKAAEREGG
jgi:DNA-directed RNA polymerase subunit RPC12/RpoP